MMTGTSTGGAPGPAAQGVVESPAGLTAPAALARGTQAAPEGVVVIDKPADWTSHDVVGRVRRLAGTRKVGHAGTLDPMATGVLVVGIGRATRLLGHLSGQSKAYEATIRLGWATHTDDAQGERGPGALAADLAESAIRAGMAVLTGSIMQRPSAVSAIKVDGQRAHARVRAGESVQLEARPVVVSRFDLLALRRLPELGAVDLDVAIDCSSGTYVRALARDLGESLGTGGHLTALRRSRVGPFLLDSARSLDELAQQRDQRGAITVSGLAEVARAVFPAVSVTERDDAAIRHGRAIDLTRVWAPFRTSAAGGAADGAGAAPDEAQTWSDRVGAHALFSQAGELLALVRPDDEANTSYLAVFAQP